MNVIKQIKNKVGDFWWYSLMICIACRSGDVIQAFIGLWLVPKYVGAEELGAILPLQQLCSLFTAPLMAMSVVFSQYITTYATRGEYGKVKSFVFDVIFAAMAIFIICVLSACVILPHFYLRLKIASGLLTVLILCSGFTNNISQLLQNALQGLKKFNAMTLQHFIGAPIRLVTMLVAMPFRALSGYILGQTTPPASSAVISLFTLRNELKSVPKDTSWRKDLPDICRFLVPMLVYHVFSMSFVSVIMTVYRQRLPEIESAAYYMLSRFAELATYAGGSMTVILFPLAAEAHENGKESTAALKKTFAGTMIFTALLVITFFFTANTIFSLTETWKTYLPFAGLLPVMTITMGATAILGAVTVYETACRRFAITMFLLAANGIWCAFLLTFTGYEFFRGMLPDAVIDWIASTQMTSLSKLTWAHMLFTLLQLAILPVSLRKNR